MSNYICMTTIPPRFNTLLKISNSYLKNNGNNIKKIKIYIPIKYNRFNNNFKIPIIKNDKIQIIRTKKDYGPITKFIGPLLDKEIKPSDNIFIVDDDYIKDKNWMFVMNYFLKKNVNKIIQNSKNFKIPQINGSKGFCFKKRIIKMKYFKKFFKSIPDKFKLIDDDILTIFFDLLRTKILLVNFKNNKNQLFNQGVGLNNITERMQIRKEFNNFLIRRFNFGYKYNLYV